MCFLNLSEDELFDFGVELDKEYAEMEIFGAEGELKGGRVEITSAVPAYGAFAIVLKKMI